MWAFATPAVGKGYRGVSRSGCVPLRGLRRWPGTGERVGTWVRRGRVPGARPLSQVSAATRVSELGLVMPGLVPGAWPPLSRPLPSSFVCVVAFEIFNVSPTDPHGWVT